MRSIFYTPAQPQRSSRLEGRRHTRQESRGESVSLRSARLSGGDLHSVRATSAGHIETDAHEPIGLSAARLRSQFFFFLPFICLRVHPGRLATFCRPYLNGTRCSGSRGCNIKAAAAAVAPQKRCSETTDRKDLRARGKPEVSEGIFSRDEAAAASGGNLAENVITGQAAVIASMPFQLEGRSFSWTGGRIHFWLPQGGMLHC